MTLRALYAALADAFDGPQPIEARGRAALLKAAPPDFCPGIPVPLAAPFLDILSHGSAHPCCALIAATPLPWAAPETSSDPLYRAHSAPKVHVELIGPDGVVPSDEVRLGLYGILPEAHYGLRTHPAEEIFVMLAGAADWKRGDAPFVSHGPGERSHHPTMMPHATRTRAHAFMSLYVWTGDVSTDGYVYQGIPAD